MKNTLFASVPACAEASAGKYDAMRLNQQAGRAAERNSMIAQAVQDARRTKGIMGNYALRTKPPTGVRVQFFSGSHSLWRRLLLCPDLTED